MMSFAATSTFAQTKTCTKAKKAACQKASKVALEEGTSKANCEAICKILNCDPKDCPPKCCKGTKATATATATMEATPVNYVEVKQAATTKKACCKNKTASTCKKSEATATKLAMKEE